MWIHASPNFLDDGTVLTSPDERGVDPRWSGAASAKAMAVPQYRSDRVYMLLSPDNISIDSQIGHFQFITADSYIYAVEPIGQVEVDPDHTMALVGSWCSVQARVLRRLRSVRQQQ